MQEAQLRSNALIITFLAIYFVWLCVNMGHIIPHFDSFYYWDWSRHLALSYYDGPPLVAYVLAIYTKIFGNSLFAINLFSLVSVYITGFIVYKASRLIMDKRSALFAMALWIVSPVVIQYLMRQSTYDNVLNLFWALSIYFAIKFTIDNKNKNLYWIGVSLGLCMLAKYTGVTLILGFIVFSFIVPRYRKLYSNIHFYVAMLIILAIFSPVIIWNAKHHWISITFQAGNHIANVTGLWGHILNMLRTVGAQIIPLYNYLIVIVLYGCFKRWDQIKRSDSLQLLLIISLVFVVFYFLVSLLVKTHPSWFLPLSITGTMLSAYFLSTLKMKKTALVLLIVYAVLGVLLLMVNSFWATRLTLEGGRYSAIQAFNKQYGEHHPIIVTSSWMSARMLFFLAGQPYVYTLPGDAENQYHYWSRQVLSDIQSKKIKKVLYVDFDNRYQNIEKYFSKCKALSPATYEQHRLFTGKIKTYRLNVYLCTNS